MESKDNSKEMSAAVILQFPARRGRPRKNLPKNDRGTNELIKKRAAGDTAESLDLCLQRSIITSQQHWCGIHLRWLYTLRYGAPGVRAIDPAHLGGIEIKPEDPDWKEQRESEYNEAVKTLRRAGLSDLMLSICIFNERPNFLKTPASLKHHKTLEVEMLKKGLDTLCALWLRIKDKN